ncbi:MAG: hypothetical protein AAGJ56_01115 [Myxococcota bacterium]
MDKAQQFRDAMAERFGEKRPARYPKDLRELALEYLADRRRAGSELSETAKALGIDPNTLRTWAQREQASSAAPMSEITDEDVFTIGGWAPYVAEWDSSAADPPVTRWSLLASLTHVLLSSVVGIVLAGFVALPSIGTLLVSPYSPIVGVLLLVLQLVVFGYAFKWVMARESACVGRLHALSRRQVRVGAKGVVLEDRRGERFLPFNALKAPWLILFPWCLVLRRDQGWPIVLLGREELRDLQRLLNRRRPRPTRPEPGE